MSEKERVKAALKGQQDWGRHGSATEHERYSLSVRTRRRCRCGCGERITHAGVANGVTLMSGCEMSVRRWVRAS